MLPLLGGRRRDPTSRSIGMIIMKAPSVRARSLARNRLLDLPRTWESKVVVQLIPSLPRCRLLHHVSSNRRLRYSSMPSVSNINSPKCRSLHHGFSSSSSFLTKRFRILTNKANIKIPIGLHLYSRLINCSGLNPISLRKIL